MTALPGKSLHSSSHCYNHAPMHAILESLRGADEALFRLINGVWTHPWLDATLPVVTDINKQAWFWPLALLLSAFWLYTQRGRAAKVLLGLVLSVALSDMMGHRVIKPMFKRARPEKAGVEVVLRTRSHKGHSLPSNHAANSFSAATFMSAVYPAWRPAFLAFAALVAYSRVYSGVHFPFDVLLGSLLGAGAGWLVWLVFRELRLTRGGGPRAAPPRRR